MHSATPRRDQAQAKSDRASALARSPRIPTFFEPKKQQSEIDRLVKTATLQDYAKAYEDCLLTPYELDGIWHMIIRNSEDPMEGEEHFITYAGVCNVAAKAVETLGPRISFHFTPSKFLSHQLNAVGGASSVAYFKAICRRNFRLDLKLQLLRLDRRGDGTIEVDDLDVFFERIVDSRLVVSRASIPLPRFLSRIKMQSSAVRQPPTPHPQQPLTLDAPSTTFPHARPTSRTSGSAWQRRRSSFTCCARKTTARTDHWDCDNLC